METRLGEL